VPEGELVRFDELLFVEVLDLRSITRIDGLFAPERLEIRKSGRHLGANDVDGLMRERGNFFGQGLEHADTAGIHYLAPELKLF
jgi:hypothetical protein